MHRLIRRFAAIIRAGVRLLFAYDRLVPDNVWWRLADPAGPGVSRAAREPGHAGGPFDHGEVWE